MSLFIICGPPASGKTLNAAALAEHLGCEFIADGGVPRELQDALSGRRPLQHDEALRDPHILVLTNSMARFRREYPTLADMQIYGWATVEGAKELLGERWVEPVPASNEIPATTD